MSPTRINLHISDGESPDSGRTYPLLSRAALSTPARGGNARGFTVLEVSIAVSLFLVIASVLTLALARSTAVNVSERLGRQLDTRASSLLEQVAQSPYERLLDGTFEVPPGDANLQVSPAQIPEGCEGLTFDDDGGAPNFEPDPARASCLEVGTRAYAVRYSVETAEVGAEGSGATTALVTATITPADGPRRGDDPVLSEGGQLVLTRKVSPPVTGLRGGNEGLVRVTVRDDRLDRSAALPLYLFAAGGTPAGPIAVGSIPAGGQESVAVLLRDTEGVCASTRCAIGLRVPTPNDPSELGYAETGSIGMSLDTTREGAGFLVPVNVPEQPAEVVEQSISVFDRGSARISLVARNAEGRTASPPQETGGSGGARNDSRGSVCLWVSFRDGSADRSVPACNFSDASTIVLERYYPNLESTTSFPFPVGVPLRLSVDSPAGNCPAIPNRSFVTGSSAPPQARGSVARADNAGGWQDAAVCTGYTWGVPAELTVFSTGTGAGTETRAFDDTQFSFTLAPQKQTQIEVVWKCETSPCTARPATGDVPAGSSVPAAGLWSKPRGATECARPTTASCTSPGAQYSPEDTECGVSNPHCRSVATAAPRLTAPSNPFAVSYTGPRTFTLSVADSDAGESFTVSQNPDLPSSPTISCTGLPASSPVVNPTTPPATVNRACSYTGPASAGLQVLELRLEDNRGLVRDVTVPLVPQGTVLPFQLQVGSAQLTQGGKTMVSVTATGTDGLPLRDTPVTFTAPAGRKLSFTPATVTTGPTGAATTELSAEASAPGGPGAADLRVQFANGRGANFSAQVIQKVARVEFSGDPSGPQGGRITFGAAAFDGANAPVANQEIGLAVLSSGVPAELVYPKFAGCRTDGAGRCAGQEVVIELRAPAGGYELRASGVASPPGAFAVTQVPAQARIDTIAAGGGIRIPQGEPGPALLQILDGAGRPYVGSQVATPEASGGGELTPTTSRAVIDSSGFLRDAMGAPSLQYVASATAQAKVWQAAVRVAGVRLAFPISITPTAQSIEIIAPTGQPAVNPQFTVKQNGSTSIVVVVKDGAGALMQGAYVSFLLTTPGGVPSSVRIGAAASTNNLGQAVSPITAASDAPAGKTYTIEVRNAEGSIPPVTATLQISAGGAP